MALAPRYGRVMSTHAVTITHFTDPTCPFAFSAEPRLRVLEWRYGDQLSWHHRMVGLLAHPDDAAARGLTVARISTAWAGLASQHGMPIISTPIPRLYESVSACRAVCAAAAISPSAAELVLRAFRVHHFAGHLVDDPHTLAMVCADAGVDQHTLTGLVEAPSSAEALALDMSAARTPSAAALAQPARLAPSGESWRYTCPSLELMHTSGATISAPGFQPLESYELAMANLAPDLERRPAATDVSQVLEWAAFPLASAEVAAICERPVADVEDELTRQAAPVAVGAVTYWQIAA